MALLRQSMYEFILQIICILILVYHYIFKSLLIIRKHITTRFKQLYSIPEQVIKIHSVILLQIFHVSRIYLCYRLGFEIHGVIIYIIVGIFLSLLTRAYYTPKVRNRINLFINLKVFDDSFEKSLLI